MYIQQICPGKSNGYVQSLNTALWNNSRYIVFGTADKVVIYDGHFKHMQTICVREFLVDLVTSPECKVISVELSNTHGQLAVTIESYVLIFCPNKQSGQDEMQWILNAILRHDSPVCCTSWNLNYDKHELWVGGGKISLWKCDIDGNTTSSWTKEYERSVASNVTLIKVSPDSSLVATVGKYDRMVKIWWQSLNNARAYEFEYLSHPGAVTSLNWRLGTDEMRTPGQNTLFTMCRDGICRIWSSTNPEEPCVLYIAAVIDPNHEVLATPIHWIHAAEFVSAVRLALDALEGEGQNGVGNLVRRLTSLANNTPDLMYQVQKDGSMIIWAIQNLNARPRRIVRVLVLLRMAQALFPLDAVYFSGSVSVYHDHSGLKTKSTIFPADLTLIAQSPHGRINCYTINLTDFFDSTRPTTRLYLKHSMTGHHSDVVDIIKAPGTDSLASIAKDGEVIVWDTETPMFGARVSQGMVERSPVWLDSKIKLACLLPGGRLLAAYDGSQIVLFFCGTADGHSTQLSVLDGYDPAYPLSLLFAFPQMRNGTPSSVSHVAGVSLLDGSIFCWRVEFSDRPDPSVHFISHTCLYSSSHLAITHAVSVNQWAGAYSKCNTYPPDCNPPVLLTCSSTGRITYWRCKLSVTNKAEREKGKLWEESYRLKSEDQEGIWKIKCGPEDKVALVNKARDKVSIWEAITPRLPSMKEYVIESSETIIDVDWLYTSCGGLVLAVASAQKITIYTRLRKLDALVRECWIALTDIQIPLTMCRSVSAISWASSGTLVVAAGNQMRCYCKWMNATKLRQVSRMTGINEKLPTVFHAVSHVNGPLPHHHPSVLLQYLLWGKMDLVKLVLAHLYNNLKILVDAKRPITRMLPVPFDKLFEEDSPPAVTPKKSRYSELFGDDSDGDSSLYSGIFEFTEEEADFLSDHLKKVALPDLSNIEQAQLLALVDTVMQVESQKRSLDENGVRYVIFMRRYNYLNRASLSGVPRESGLSYRDMSWALHSESQDLLIEYSIAASGGKFLWKDARNHGIFLWLRNIETVRQQMEIIARNQYLSKEDRDPTGCSLFYMALKKKKLLLGLWRTANSHKEQAKHLQFLANDFDEPRWRTAASKNAFVLLGKQRYEYAAAFFLLADKLKDAVNVCLKNLDDFQLAIAICRVYEGDDGPVLKSVFEDYVIPLAVKNKDRWLAHIVYWFTNQRDLAIKATMLPLDELRDYQPTGTYDTSSHDAALIVLYKQLKEKSVQTIRGASEISAEIEYTLVLHTIFAYERMGCPLLALHLLKTWVFATDIASEFSQIYSPSSPTSSVKRLRPRRRTTILDVPMTSDNIFSSGVVSADDWGWSEAQTPRSRHGSLKLVTDIFADEPDSGLEYLRSPVDLFSGSGSGFGSGMSAGQNSAYDSDCNNTTLLHDKDLGMYKYSLVKRLSEQFIDGVAIIMRDSELFDRRAIYQDYVEMLKQGLNSICKAAGMPVKDMEETCTEVDYYALPFYLLNRSLISENVTERISTTLVNGSCTMAMLAFGSTKSRQDMDDHLMKWAKDTLLSINEWIPVLNTSSNNHCDGIDITHKTTTTTTHDAHNQRNTPSPSNDGCQLSAGVQKIAFASYLTLTLLSVRQQEYDIAWSCVFSATKFFHSALATAPDLSSAVQDIIRGISDQPIVTNNEDNSYENWGGEDADRDDMFGEEEIFSAYDQTLAANILQVATINHLVHLLEKFLHTCSSSIGDEIEPFITTAYLESMIEYSTNMEREVMRALPEPTYDMIPKIIRDPNQQQFWNSLRRINHIKVLLPNFVRPSTYESSSKATSVIEQADAEA